MNRKYPHIHRKKLISTLQLEVNYFGLTRGVQLNGQIHTKICQNPSFSLSPIYLNPDFAPGTCSHLFK